MLDKSIPYFNVIMVRKAGTPVLAPALADGYSLETFMEGDENSWVDIEHSVGEQESEIGALEYFRTKYIPHLPELKRRSFFMRANGGDKIGTCTIWWDMTGDRRDVSLHWLAVKPGHQGLGLGKVLVAECLQRSIQLDGRQDVYLHTQTWSYKAIGIYLQARFEIMQEETFGQYKNDYREAIPILREKLGSRMR